VLLIFRGFVDTFTDMNLSKVSEYFIEADIGFFFLYNGPKHLGNI
jgi:hypothetical protein